MNLLLRRRELVVLGAAGALLGPAPHALARGQERLFGGPVDLLLPDRAAARREAGVMRALRDLDTRWNAWKPGELGALNATLQRGGSVRPRLDLAALLRWSAHLEALSLGTFNPAIGAAVGAWGFHADHLRDGPEPDATALRYVAQAAPSLAQLEWRGADLRSRNARLQIDLGGIGKGWAIDAMLDGLSAAGVGDALLNLGGNLAVMGSAGGRRWRVGVRDPHGPGVLAWLETTGREAVVTSGLYERRRRAGAAEVSHVIDPRSAQPVDVRAGLASVTVVHPSATLADAAATALLVAGPGRWRQVAQRLGVAQVLVVDADGRRIATPALATRLQRSG